MQWCRQFEKFLTGYSISDLLLHFVEKAHSHLICAFLQYKYKAVLQNDTCNCNLQKQANISEGYNLNVLKSLSRLA